MSDATISLTYELARRASSLKTEDIPIDVFERARHCLLDWFGCAISGSQEPVAAIVREAVGCDYMGGTSTVVGVGAPASMRGAALINGTASHALDFDDVNPSLLGHPSVAILGGALALGERIDAKGSDLLRSFVAGYETACRVAVAVGPEPYQRGYHFTGTVGALGAAAASASLLGLTCDQTAVALGVAATQAAGLKCMIGSMGKSFHAGKACENGLLAALLAARGFEVTKAAIEANQGMAAAFGGRCDSDAALAGSLSGWHLRDTLFKYHASCFMTHSMIDGMRNLREANHFEAADIRSVVVHVSDLELGACNIGAPATALEIKFSLVHLAAMSASGRDLSVIADKDAVDPLLLELRRRISVVGGAQPGTPTRVEVTLVNGRDLVAAQDVLTATSDLDAQRMKLTAKFRALSEPVIGPTRSSQLIELLAHAGSSTRVADVLACAAAANS